MCACQWKANVINTTVSHKAYIYNLPYVKAQTQLASMHQQETLVRIYKLKITK